MLKKKPLFYFRVKIPSYQCTIAVIIHKFPYLYTGAIRLIRSLICSGLKCFDFISAITTLYIIHIIYIYICSYCVTCYICFPTN